MGSFTGDMSDPDNVGVPEQRETLSQFISNKTHDHELAMLMTTMQMACKGIARAVKKAGIAELYGVAGLENSSGDDVKKLDVLSNDIMCSALINSNTCAVLVSEEQEEPLIVPEDRRGNFCVAFDPLDGSSNIDCNVSTGTIFGVYKKLPESTGKTEDTLRPGNELLVAGYCMYGAAVEMVICGGEGLYGQGVHHFALDPSMGEFIHIGVIKIPEGGGKKIYSINEGNYSLWDDNIKKSVDQFKGLTGDKPYSARYVGSMVSDVHRTLLYGGIFMYPADTKSTKGKLRVLYEGFPMALITEAAGGAASTGMFNGSVGRILDVVPTDIHERCPIIMGCDRDVSKVLALYDSDGKSPKRAKR